MAAKYEVITFARQNFPAHLPRSRKPSQPALSYEHIENFTIFKEVMQDLGNRASLVNPAHVKRP